MSLSSTGVGSGFTIRAGGSDGAPVDERLDGVDGFDGFDGFTIRAGGSDGAPVVLLLREGFTSRSSVGAADFHFPAILHPLTLFNMLL